MRRADDDSSAVVDGGGGPCRSADQADEDASQTHLIGSKAGTIARAPAGRKEETLKSRARYRKAMAQGTRMFQKRSNSPPPYRISEASMFFFPNSYCESNRN